MKLSLVASIALILFAPTWAASRESSEATAIVGMIERNAAYDNAGDTEKSRQDYAPTATIIDSVPPYLWSGPNAYKDWWAASADDMRRNGLTDPVTELQPARSVKVDGDRAYAVFPVIFTFKSHGEPGRAMAVLTYALVKIGGRWLISGWSFSEG